ncbi:MAG: coproporphyrinogen III oxidase [Flavobacteriaceae bacterium]|nr:coproporphyrinogen III oxidase [Flavobacteriaceae bacterium]
MAGIYIHIPFCKQACSYCNFHFSTSLRSKDAMIQSIIKEVVLKSIDYKETIETIYFGGGTPSILSIQEINQIISKIFKNYNVSDYVEITLETNPDDITENKLAKIADTKINRLSIGVQSFIEKELIMMKRIHNSVQAQKSVELSLKFFNNISIDLIYGVPESDMKSWKSNMDISLKFDLNHYTAYALTLEPKTILKKYTDNNIIEKLDDDVVYDQYYFTNKIFSEKDYINYELSSYAKKGFFSKNNSGYWLRKKYIGVGPSAHSFDGEKRTWNLSNNTKYINAINNGQGFFQSEYLSIIDKYNEYVMTGLRTVWGVSLKYLEVEFGEKYKEFFVEKSRKYFDLNYLRKDNNIVTTTIEGRFLADGISSDLFVINGFEGSLKDQ